MAVAPAAAAADKFINCQSNFRVLGMRVTLIAQINKAEHLCITIIFRKAQYRPGQIINFS